MCQKWYNTCQFWHATKERMLEFSQEDKSLFLKSRERNRNLIRKEVSRRLNLSMHKGVYLCWIHFSPRFRYLCVTEAFYGRWRA